MDTIRIVPGIAVCPPRKRSYLALRRKSILAPIFAADAVMDEEQALRIILALDFQQL